MKADRHMSMVICFGIFNNFFQIGDILFQRSLLLMQIVPYVFQVFCIRSNLTMQTGLGLMHQMPVMLPLHAPFQTQSNQQTDSDGEQMDEEVAPAMNWL